MHKVSKLVHTAKCIFYNEGIALAGTTAVTYSSSEKVSQLTVK